jgi:hypothetical protein
MLLEIEAVALADLAADDLRVAGGAGRVRLAA